MTILNSQETWDRVETLVLAFQSGHEEAGVELMLSFDNYFRKYTNIILKSDIDFKDRESRFFISLFMQKDDYKKVRRPFQQSETISKALQAVSFIRNTYGQATEEDIKQDFYMIFFKLIKRYKPMGKSFGAYLCTSFVYELARHIRTQLKDPISRSKNVLQFCDMCDDHGTQLSASGGVVYGDMIDLIDEITFSETWIVGLTCSDEFIELTQFERLILIKYYVEEKTDKKIADETGFKRNTINKKRAKAINKIKAKLLDDNIGALV